MKFQYLGEWIEAELQTNYNDYDNATEQVLTLRNIMFDNKQARWSVLVKEGSELPWLYLSEALTAVLWSDGGIIRRYKKRMTVRRVAKYITGNAKKASARSLRKTVLAAMQDLNNLTLYKRMI